MFVENGIKTQIFIWCEKYLKSLHSFFFFQSISFSVTFMRTSLNMCTGYKWNFLFKGAMKNHNAYRKVDEGDVLKNSMS